MAKCPEDYNEWLVTMYCQLGNKWSNLHHGPKWSVVLLEQSVPGSIGADNTGPMQVRWL